MSPDELPPPVAAFFAATRARDAAALFAALRDTVIHDAGKTYRGDEIGGWNERFYLGAGVAVDMLGRVAAGEAPAFRVMIDGDYDRFGVYEPFPQIWRFTLAGDRIRTLEMIEPERPVLPPPVERYVAAANAFDLDALVACFLEDALVNDARREFWGREAIRRWAARELIGDRVTMAPGRTIAHRGELILSATMNGDYDRTGLPDPLVLTFHFAVEGDGIARLVVLHNRRARLG